MELYEVLNNKFGQILSGDCLTHFRNENIKIAEKHSLISEKNFLKIKEDFKIYIKNYLFLKNYTNIEETDCCIIATLNENRYEFFLDFDWEENIKEEYIKLKILDKGLKTGISTYEGKYFFLISVFKGIIFLMNSETLKSQIKEKRSSFEIITENKDLFKTQFIKFRISDLAQKVKIFSIK